MNVISDSSRRSGNGSVLADVLRSRAVVGRCRCRGSRNSLPTVTGAMCWPSRGSSRPRAARRRSRPRLRRRWRGPARELPHPADRSRRAASAAPAPTASRRSSSSRPTFGHANGVVRLVEDADGTWRAWTLLTTLEELHGYPDGRPPALSDAERFSRDFGGENWLDQRRKAAGLRRPRSGGAGGGRRPGRPRGRGPAQCISASTR